MYERFDISMFVSQLYGVMYYLMINWSVHAIACMILMRNFGKWTHGMVCTICFCLWATQWWKTYHRGDWTPIMSFKASKLNQCDLEIPQDLYFHRLNYHVFGPYVFDILPSCAILHDWTN